MNNWLNEANETEFQFDKSALQETAQKINANAESLQSLASSLDMKVQDKVESKQVIFDGMSAFLIENGPEEKNVLPYTEELSEEQARIIDGYSKAEKFMLKKLKEEPFLYPDLMKALHKVISDNDDNVPLKDKGRYRVDEVVTGLRFNATATNNIENEMNMAFFNFAFRNPKLCTEDVFAQIAKLHAQIVRIQPFIDGNKRVAFLATNGMLKLYGFPIIDLCKDNEESKKYCEALDAAIVGRDVTSLALLFANKVKHRQNETIKAIKIKNIEDNFSR